MNLASTPALLREKIVLSEDKLNDVSSLLKNRFGDDWKKQKNLQYFVKLYQKGTKNSVSGKNTKKVEYVVEEIDEECTCCAEDEPTFLQ